MFQITGIIILSVGISVQSAYNAYHQFLSERFFSLPAFCIATGIIIFLIAGAGFYGAYMENYLMNMAVSVNVIIYQRMYLTFEWYFTLCILRFQLNEKEICFVFCRFHSITRLSVLSKRRQRKILVYKYPQSTGQSQLCKCVISLYVSNLCGFIHF